MENLYETYLGYMTPGLRLAVASNAVAPETCAKMKLRPVRIGGRIMYQATRTVGPKELHENLSAEDAAALLEKVTGEQFRQIEIDGTDGRLLVMVSKRGTVTVKRSKAKPQAGRESVSADRTASAGSGNTSADTGILNMPADGMLEGSGSHAADTPVAGSVHGIELAASESLYYNNRKKNHVLPEGEPVPFLVSLGVMTAQGRVVASRYDKFRQINRYLEFVSDIIPSLPKGREISIIDFGCGKSYLTFALYYYLHGKLGYDVRITGLDLKKDVIEECNRLAREFGYEKLQFLHGDIADYTGTDSVDMVVTLHACDTATDYALYKAVTWGARVILCVPCCQHEVNKTIRNEGLRPLLKYGLIKERMSALITDALRANILEEQGYKTQILEFIDMEHTPKNILIRAVKQPKQMKTDRTAASAKTATGYEQLMNDLNSETTLYRLLHETC